MRSAFCSSQPREHRKGPRKIAKLANPFLLHFPLSDGEELPTFRLSVLAGGIGARTGHSSFLLNHVMELDDPMDAFRLEQLEVGNGAHR